MELIRRELEAFALVFPNVAFTLENTTGAGGASLSKDRSVRIPKVGTPIFSAAVFFSDAKLDLVHSGIVPTPVWARLNRGQIRFARVVPFNPDAVYHAQHVEEIDLMSGELKLQGFISLNGAHSKASTIYLGPLSGS